jgi:hypothetical protein
MCLVQPCVPQEIFRGWNSHRQWGGHDKHRALSVGGSVIWAKVSWQFELEVWSGIHNTVMSKLGGTTWWQQLQWRTSEAWKVPVDSTRPDSTQRLYSHLTIKARAAGVPPSLSLLAPYPWWWSQIFNVGIQCGLMTLPMLKNFFPGTDTKTGCTVAGQCHSKLANGNWEQ